MYVPGSYKHSNTLSQSRPYNTVRQTQTSRNQVSSKSPVRRDNSASKTAGKQYSYPVSETKRSYDGLHKTMDGGFSNYKNKRPGQILDTMENERELATNGSTPSNGDKSRGYIDPLLVQSISTIKTPQSNTRANSKKGRGKASETDLDSHNTSYKAPVTPKGKNHPSYIAEKVYSVKMKKSGILGSITPMGKSTKSPGLNLQSYGKSRTATTAKSNFEDNDEYMDSPLNLTKPEGNIYTEITDRSVYSSANMTIVTPKKKTANNIQASLGKLLNEGKGGALSGQKEKQLRRDDSWGKITPPKLKMDNNKTVSYKDSSFSKIPSPMQPKSARGNTTNITTNINNYVNHNTSINKTPEAMKRKAALLVDILQNRFNKINERNKRIVLMQMLSIVHDHNVKITDFLERRMLRKKAKFFYTWQNFVLSMNDQQQELAEERKLNLAAAYYNRKLKRKALNGLIIAVNSAGPKCATTNQSFISNNTHNTSNISRNVNSPRKGNNPLSSKSSIVQSKSTTLVVYPAAKKIPTPVKTNTRSSQNTTPYNSSTLKRSGTGVIANKYSPTVKNIQPLESRSKSVVKITKEVDKNRSPSRSITPTGRLSKPLLLDGFGGHKPAAMSSNISPKKTTVARPTANNSPNKSTVNKTLQNSMKAINITEPNHSFGNTQSNAGFSFEKQHETFDTYYLGEGLQTSTTFIPEPTVAAVNTSKSAVQEGKNELKISTTNNNLMFDKRKSSTLSTTASKVKDLSVNTDILAPKTSRGYNSPKGLPPSPVKNYPLTFRNRQEDPKPDLSFKKLNLKSNQASPSLPMNKLDVKKVQSSTPLPEEDEIKNDLAIKFYKRKLYKNYGNQLLTYLKLSALKNKIAVTHRRNSLLQNAYVYLLANSTQAVEERMRGEIKAEEHYKSGLLIKALSGLIKNFVKGFRDQQLSEDHFREKQLKACFNAWSLQAYESSKKENGNEETYNEIVERFRFIVLAEKVIRQWKLEVSNSKKMKKPAPSPTLTKDVKKYRK